MLKSTLQNLLLRDLIFIFLLCGTADRGGNNTNVINTAKFTPWRFNIHILSVRHCGPRWQSDLVPGLFNFLFKSTGLRTAVAVRFNLRPFHYSKTTGLRTTVAQYLLLPPLDNLYSKTTAVTFNVKLRCVALRCVALRYVTLRYC